MSSLAFDKNGRPFKFSRLARRLYVRIFPNAGGRGSCFPVRDDDGDELSVEAEADFGEFRRAVKNLPGYYRLDQYDEHDQEIEDAQPAYVTIHDPAARNASGIDGGDPMHLVVLKLGQSNADLASANADVTRTALAEFAGVMRATAEILHSPIKPLPALPVVVRNDNEPGNDEDDDDDEIEEKPASPFAAFAPIMEMVRPVLPQIGAALYQILKDYMAKNAPPVPSPTTPPAPSTPPPAATSTTASEPAASAPPPASAAPGAASASAAAPASTAAPASAAAPSAAPEPMDVAAGPSPRHTAPASVSSPPRATTSAPPAAAPRAPASDVAAPAASSALAIVPAPSDTPSGEPRNATLAPTPEQWAHLYAIRERLTPKEAAIAEAAIGRMPADVLAQWMAELSVQAVDDAVQTIRLMLAQLRRRGMDRS